MTKIFQVLLIMACTRGKNQHERAHSITITSNFQATSKRIPRDFHKSSRTSSCLSESSQCPEKSMPNPSPEKQIDPKNGSKRDPKRCPGGAWGTPGASRGLVRADFQTQLKIYEKNEGFWEAPRRPGRPPGTQRDPKNRQKVDIL